MVVLPSLSLPYQPPASTIAATEHLSLFLVPTTTKHQHRSAPPPHRSGPAVFRHDGVPLPSLPTPHHSPIINSAALGPAASYQHQLQPAPVSFLCPIEALPGPSQMPHPSLYEHSTRNAPHHVRRSPAGHPASHSPACAHVYASARDLDCLRASTAATGRPIANMSISTPPTSPILASSVHNHGALQLSVDGHGPRHRHGNGIVLPQESEESHLSEPFACPQCRKRFLFESQLDTHLRTH
jgi:hypothetical protein